MESPVFAIANQKGGVGKTTSAVNLSAGLAANGIDTLLIDLDPQANATSGLGLEKEEGTSAYGPLMGEGTLSEKIVESGREHLFAIRSERDLVATEVELPRDEDYLFRLKGLIDAVREEYGFGAIILDCPPSSTVLSLNALAAADYLVVALQCEYLAMEGLGEILSMQKQIKEGGVNSNLEVAGILMTMFDIRTNLSNQVVSEVRSHFGDQVFSSVIPRNIRLTEAPSFGQTIFEYEKSSSGALAYEKLAQEFISRFGLKPSKGE
ncbi:ParA family protein [Puniceicoccus vermicola]|uniref:ParA family protein n=1 Tax=Puniceicoccus vermicola TaxID=388746 RepID=A0A7X1E800_9BACT|nr:ParA family protein [Puniceicoccus vermicola]MBC2604267.1 ParA family protein [Puniceicoccus vermicola]